MADQDLDRAKCCCFFPLKCGVMLVGVSVLLLTAVTISNQIYDFYRINNLMVMCPVWLMLTRMIAYSIFLLNSVVFTRWMLCKDTHVVRLWLTKTTAWLSVALVIYSVAWIVHVWTADDYFFEVYYFNGW